jgi:hypothetical protein
MRRCRVAVSVDGTRADACAGRNTFFRPPLGAAHPQGRARAAPRRCASVSAPNAIHLQKLRSGARISRTRSHAERACHHRSRGSAGAGVRGPATARKVSVENVSGISSNLVH